MNLKTKIEKFVKAQTGEFSVFDCTRYLRQNGDLVAHRDVKKVFYQDPDIQAVVELKGNNGMYNLFVLNEKDTQTVNTSPVHATTSPVNTPTSTLERAVLRYLKNMSVRSVQSASMKQIQSALKRDGNFTCTEILDAVCALWEREEIDDFVSLSSSNFDSKVVVSVS